MSLRYRSLFLSIHLHIWFETMSSLSWITISMAAVLHLCFFMEVESYLPHKITHLPGQPPISFQHFSGYITVDDKEQRALFYYFAEAEIDPVLKPVVLWLNGGLFLLTYFFFLGAEIFQQKLAPKEERCEIVLFFFIVNDFLQTSIRRVEVSPFGVLQKNFNDIVNERRIDEIILRFRL